MLLYGFCYSFWGWYSTSFVPEEEHGTQERERWYYFPQNLRALRLVVVRGRVESWAHGPLNLILFAIFSTGRPRNPKLPLPSASLPCSPRTEPQQTYLCSEGELRGMHPSSPQSWNLPASLTPAGMVKKPLLSIIIIHCVPSPSPLLVGRAWVELGASGLRGRERERRLSRDFEVFWHLTGSSSWLFEVFLLTSFSAAPPHLVCMCAFACSECTCPFFSLQELLQLEDRLGNVTRGAVQNTIERFTFPHKYKKVSRPAGQPE